MRLELLQALQASYQRSKLAGVTSGMWLGMAPEGATEPYITIGGIDGAKPEKRGIDGRILQSVEIEFHIWSRSRSTEEVIGLFDTLCNLYDGIELEPRAGAVCAMTRGADYLEEVVEDDGRGWRIVVVYSALHDNLSATE